MKSTFFMKIISFHRNILDYFGSLKVKKYIHTSKKIRILKNEDLVRILELYYSCFGRKDFHQIYKYSRLFRNTFYVYEENGIIIAYVGFYIHLKIENFKLVQKAMGFSECVDEQQRGKGLFTSIYRECLSELKNNNVEVVYACIRKNNSASLRVHQKLGFKIYEKNNNLCGSDEYYQVELKLDDSLN
jgi:L-amino acid N-acyltransferase YncA